MHHFHQVPRDWLPPHCPNPNCRYHKQFTHRSDFKRLGYYTTRANPKRIPRFLCHHCHRSFSRQTFSTTYWQKRPDLDRRLFMRVVSCAGNRQIARDLGVAPETVARHLARLGRHCLLFHARELARVRPFTAVVVDGFESFEYSQYFPLHLHVAVDPKSWYFIYFTDSELRRKGRMTAAQKRRRGELEGRLGRPSPRAIAQDMGEVLRVVLRGAVSAVVYSDEHPAYRRSLQQVAIPVVHRQTNSRAPRHAANELAPVNALDGLLRHSSANHKRETIAYAKRRQAAAEKAAILLVWRNAMKWCAENKPGQTPAMRLGLRQQRLTVDELLQERIFRSQVALPPRWDAYYQRRVTTRALAHNRRHELTYAF